MAKQSLLLLTDIFGLGRKGEIVSVKAGYARNYLLHDKRSVVATKNTIRMQEKLKKERQEQALADRKDAEGLAEKINALVLEVTVKVDPEGHMYGSVSAGDLVKLLAEQGFDMDRHFVQLPHPIKQTGVHNIEFRLKEGVNAACKLKVMPEGVEFIEEAPEGSEEEASEEEVSEESSAQESADSDVNESSEEESSKDA